MDISEKAKAVLLKYWDGEIPVDPFLIAENLGMRVIANPELAPASGEYRLEDDVPTIYINPNDPLVRRRFTVAHEIGHHYLEHGDRFRDTSKHFSSTNYDPIEVQANRFAANLLMPKPIVDHYIKKENIKDIGELSNKFHVSEVAMEYRLKNLGWLR